MCSRTRALILLSFLTYVVVAIGPAQAQTTWYVDDDGTSTTCTGWTDACPDLQTALGLAVSHDQIWVAVGTYRPTSGTDRTATFYLISGVEVCGGFDGTEISLGERAGLFDQTILSGDLSGDDMPVGCTQDSPDCDSYGGLCTDGFCIIKQNSAENSYHVVTGSGVDATAVLDGFTITSGNADGSSNPDYRGAGMYNDAGSPTVANCTFVANYAHDTAGGMQNRGASPTVTDCTFSGNAARLGGGGMHNESASPKTSVQRWACS